MLTGTAQPLETKSMEVVSRTRSAAEQYPEWEKNGDTWESIGITGNHGDLIGDILNASQWDLSCGDFAVCYDRHSI